MFTNEFGQTIKADWVSLSTSVDDLTMLGTTIVRAIVRNSEVGLNVTVLESEEVFLHASLTGVTDESDAAKLSSAFGLDIRLYGDDGEYDANDSTALLHRVLELIFGEGVTYDFGIDEDVIIRMDFDSYIKRTHGL